MHKKAQITIFVILALVILVAGVLIYFFYPNISSNSNILEENPKVYFQNCVEGVFKEKVKVIGLQGGSIVPDSSFDYLGSPVEYLCYTNKPYSKCVIQRASLISHIEKELKQSLTQKVNSCFDEMKKDYIDKNYKVSLKKGDFEVQLLPKRIILRSNSSLDLTKDSSQKYNSFDVVLNNNLYELASIARVIVNWERTFGDSEPAYFMNYYPEIKVVKENLNDGVKIYLLSYRKNPKDKFQFASRGTVWPLGVPSPTK